MIFPTIVERTSSNPDAPQVLDEANAIITNANKTRLGESTIPTESSTSKDGTIFKVHYSAQETSNGDRHTKTITAQGENPSTHRTVSITLSPDSVVLSDTNTSERVYTREQGKTITTHSQPAEIRKSYSFKGERKDDGTFFPTAFKRITYTNVESIDIDIKGTEKTSETSGTFEG